MTFTQWWAQNGAVYEKAGVTEPIAKAIWGAACDNLGMGLLKKLSEG